jgi:HEAT repeat protein
MYKLAQTFVVLLVLAYVPARAQPKEAPPETEADLALIEALAKVGAGDKNSPLARRSAVEALGKLTVRDPKLLDRKRSVLQDFLCEANLARLEQDDDMVVLVVHVVKALAIMGPAARAALPDIARARGYEASLNAAVDVAIQKIEGQDQHPASAKGIKDLLADLASPTSAPTRLAAAKALGLFADPSVLGPLSTAAAMDPDPDVQRVAGGSLARVTAILQLDRKAYVEGLTALLDKGNDVTVRMIAAKKLGSLGQDALPAVTALTDAAGDADPDLKSVAANALKRIQPK